MPTRTSRILIALLIAVSVISAQTAPARKSSSSVPKGAPTLAEAEAFMKNAEAQLLDLGVRAQRATWVQENFITDDTETMSAQAQEKLTAVSTQLALDARRFDHMTLPPALRRKFMLLKLSLTAPCAQQ